MTDPRPPRKPRAGKADGNDPGLGGRVQRGTNIARLSASTGAGYLTSRVRGLRGAGLADQEFHAATAQKILEMLGSMKGAAMKVGQIASFVDLDLPPEIQTTYQDALAELRSSAPPVDIASIERVITDEFGAPPSEVFETWQREPVASASIGQVHRARLPGGTEVAVKVQYPGVAEAVESDLANAEAFAPMARLISPNLQIRPLMEELRHRLIDELDYQREAQHQQGFHDRYDGHPFVRIPRVFHDWCRPRVLTTEFVHGADFEAMIAGSSEADRQRYGEIIFRFVFGSIHRFRLFNADPHPGNYVFPGDGSVVFLDFGAVKTFRRQTRAHIQEQMRALIADDRDALLRAIREAGFIPPGHEPDRELLLDWFRTFNTAILEDREWTYTPEFAREVIRTTTDPRAGYLDMLRKLNLPPDYLLLNRIQWGVNSILGRLRATANWHRITREFWFGDPPVTELGALERPFIDASPFLA